MGYSLCDKCGQKGKISFWIQVFGSLDMATTHGQGPEFLSALMPGPGILKVEVCLGCQSFKPCLELSDEELKGVEEHSKKQGQKNDSLGNLGKTLGAIFSEK